MKKTILLTGDDGYNSLGTRVLTHYLKQNFDLTVAGTLTQQSGVGGHKHVMEHGSWGEDMVDGIPALWLDGSPVDVMEAARVYFSKPFDYCISGINWGMNIGGCLFSSGTFSAAVYAIQLGVTKKAIAISWDIPSKHHFVRHSKDEELQEFLDHPGKTAAYAIQKTLKHAFWGAEIVNINIPRVHTKIVEFATGITPIHGFWPPIILDHKTKSFSYAKGDHAIHMGEESSDAKILERNHIAIMPCQASLIDSNIYKKLQKI